MSSEQLRSKRTEILPQNDLIVDGVKDELALCLVSDQQVLIEVFEFVPEEPAHISAPLADFAADTTDGHELIDVRLLEDAHEDVHYRSASDLLGTVEKLAAKFNDQTMFVFDEEGISLLAEMPVVGFQQTTQHV